MLEKTRLSLGELLGQLMKIRAAGYDYVAVGELNSPAMLEYYERGLEALTATTEEEYETLLANEPRYDISKFKAACELLDYLDNRVENYYEDIDYIASRICRLITRQWNTTEEKGA